MPKASFSSGGQAGEPAGIIRRLAALLYDAVLLLGVLFGGSLALIALRGGQAFAPHDFFYSAFLLFVSFVFLGLSWTRNGQTLGMRAWRIRIIADDSQAIGWTKAGLRFVAGWIALALFGLGFLWILIDPAKRGWHDIVARTRVIRD